jgi:glycosyltransferase involved in cell wall biosynthesis
MSARTLRYAIITPAHDEADRLARLAPCIATQTVSPSRWVIVDDGSTDGTRATARELAADDERITVVATAADVPAARGGPVVRAFAAGLDALDDAPDIVVKLDADVTIAPDYFERLVEEFGCDPTLGIASGICLEEQDGEWRPLYGTRDHVWGAARSYRRACLEQILPLEQRQGWDEIDALKARARGWTTRTIFDLPFRHHRPEGARDGQRRRWVDQGKTAYYMGYRPSYLLARTLYRAMREPHAIGMLVGYAGSAATRADRLPDKEARDSLREQQRLRELRARAREARGRTAMPR